MGKNRIAPLADTPCEIENIDVDLARSVAKGRGASDAALDPPRGSEKLGGGASPRDLDNCVPEVGLIGVADGLRSVKGRDLPERGEAGDFAEGFFQVGAAVSDVRSEAEVRRLSSQRR